jgi:hypothetical protein
MGEDGDAGFGLFEADIGKLPGVTHARVVFERGRITEIHVVSDGLKDARQLKRDIETLARAKYDFEIDHRIISITTLPDVEIRPTRHRLELVSVSVTTARGAATCSVVVSLGEAVGDGAATGGASASGLPKVVARAAVDASSKAYGEAFPCDVQNAFIMDSDEHRIATVILMLIDEDGREVMAPGTIQVRGDHNEAVAAAVVYALNRHLGR